MDTSEKSKETESSSGSGSGGAFVGSELPGGQTRLYKQTVRFSYHQVKKFTNLNGSDAEDACHNVWERALAAGNINWKAASKYFRTAITRELVRMAGLNKKNRKDVTLAARGDVPINHTDYIPGEYDKPMDGNYAMLEDLNALGADAMDASIDFKRVLEREFSERDQAIIVGAFFDGNTTRELAAIYELSHQRVGQVLTAGREKFQEILKEY